MPFLPCSLHGRDCLGASVGVTATSVSTYKFRSKNMTQNSSALLLFPRKTTSTRLTLRRLWGAEGMKVCCRASKLISSNAASQHRKLSSPVLCSSKVAGNTIRGESPFRIAANHCPWADFEDCCFYSCLSSQPFWMWLKLAVARVGFQPNERALL